MEAYSTRGQGQPEGNHRGGNITTQAGTGLQLKRERGLPRDVFRSERGELGEEDPILVL